MVPACTVLFLKLMVSSVAIEACVLLEFHGVLVVEFMLKVDSLQPYQDFEDGVGIGIICLVGMVEHHLMLQLVVETTRFLKDIRERRFKTRKEQMKNSLSSSSAARSS